MQITNVNQKLVAEGIIQFFSGMELFYWASVFLVGFSVLVLQTNSQGK